MVTIEHVRPAEKAVLTGLLVSGKNESLFHADIEEMKLLCATAGASIRETVVQKRERPVASTFIGKGKLAEIHAIMKADSCTTLVIDAELSPGQVQNIERIIKGKVIDRSQLILDIFAQHARTTEARIQVELAQMRTLYPRLTHAWTHFSQQVGGIGTRGPGEKQLEVDRRLVQKRIRDLTAKLRKIERVRSIQRKTRQKAFKVALVGYTNAGKTSLLNALAGADALVEDKLFATLDTTTRRLFMPGSGETVITDTVGFLRKLPHHLVASFTSTLEVVTTAELLCIVLDGSTPWIEQHYATVSEVLSDLGAGGIPRLRVVNKMDLVDDPFVRKRLKLAFPDAFEMSARDRTDVKALRELIAESIRDCGRERLIDDIIAGKTRQSRAERPIPPHRYVD